MAFQTCRICKRILPLGEFQKRTKTRHRAECKGCSAEIRKDARKRMSNKASGRRIMCVGDLQAPFHHPDALPFILAVAEKFHPDDVVLIGDELDQYFLSKFERDPDADNPRGEYERAIEFYRGFFSRFPKGRGVESNHVHGRIEKKRRLARFPKAYMRSFEEIICAPPGWVWKPTVEIDGIMFAHGHRHRKNISREVEYYSNHLGKPTKIVFGHHHTEFGSCGDMLVNGEIVWGAYSGCLINRDEPAFDYTIRFPALGVLMIIDGRPTPVQMKVDANNRWVGEL